MSQGQNKWIDSNVRGDLNLWVSDPQKLITTSPNLVKLLEKMQLLQQELNVICNFNSTKIQVSL